MADAECPVCINSFKFESMRTLLCGHTYCSSCVERVIETQTLKCPECRHDFKRHHVRRIFITPSVKSATQAAPSGSPEEEGFIKQATHIASRLKKMDPDTPAQSLRTAVEIMEHVATIQSEKAQEILWKAVREFWMALVPFFEEWQQIRVLPDQVSDLRQRVTVLDQRCAALELSAENENKQKQQHSKKLQAKEREIEELKMTLRDVNARNSEERKRYRELIARHTATETKYRAQVKQLKRDLKSREQGSVPKQQLEEESLIVEPDIPYDGARSHRLDIYNDAEGSRHPKILLEKSARVDDDMDDLESLSSVPSSTQPESQAQERGRGHTKRSHRSVGSGSSSPSLRRPQFGSDWNFPRLRPRKVAEPQSLPLQLDSRGKPKGLLQYGPRVRVRTKTK